MTKRTVIIAAIVLAIAILGISLLISKEPKAHATLPTTGTWTIAEVDGDLGIGEFRFSLNSNTAITHFEVYIDDILIGDRTPINQALRTLSLLLGEPQILEVKLFADADESQPVATALLYPSGQMGIFWPGDNNPVAAVIYSMEAENGLLRCVFNRKPDALAATDFSLTLINGEEKLELCIGDFTWVEAELTAELKFQPLLAGDSPQECQIHLSYQGVEITSASFPIPVSEGSNDSDNQDNPSGDQNPGGDKDIIPPNNDEEHTSSGDDEEQPSGDDEEHPPQGEDTPPGEDQEGKNGQVGDIIGGWVIEPTFTGSFVSDFSIFLKGYDYITHYELVVAGHQIDVRTPISERIRTANILFSVPEDIVLRLYSSADDSEPVLIVNCTGQGELAIISID